jgi:SUN domain-containing protein 1/2
MIDHAQAASVVHELTSSTYRPPPLLEEKLENVWWRRYIPEDWERYLLPNGWQEWNTRLPSAVQRVLGVRPTTLPPEAILDSNIIPGSCWPISGAHGHVTLRLPYPVSVSAVTIDHAPSVLLGQLARNDGEFSSAPREIRVVGYPPCAKGCGGLGFDISKRTVLGSFIYDKEGKSIQTFDLSLADTKEDSCSETAASCSAPSLANDPIVGIRLEILSNWGFDEYTCLYRFRVHGEARR